MFSKPLPRFVIAKMLASGLTAFYFNVPTRLPQTLAALIANGNHWDLTTIAACGDERRRAVGLQALNASVGRVGRGSA